MVSLPQNTSNCLQPLELTIFGTLKSVLPREYDLFIFHHAHRHIIVAGIPDLLNNAYLRVTTMEKALYGFKAAGIVLFIQTNSQQTSLQQPNNLKSRLLKQMQKTDLFIQLPEVVLDHLLLPYFQKVQIH